MEGMWNIKKIGVFSFPDINISNSRPLINKTKYTDLQARTI
jgi:hypothetical protein